MPDEFLTFINNWLQKADAYPNGEQLSDFDRFFTLFVAYNKLYTQAFAILNSQRGDRGEKLKEYKDRDAATTSVVCYLEGSNIIQPIQQNQRSRDAFTEISDLISHRKFNFSLDTTTGESKPDQDDALSRNLESDNLNSKATALLTILYQVRCNLFHGRKQFVEDQKRVLRPSNILLKEIVILLRDKITAA